MSQKVNTTGRWVPGCESCHRDERPLILSPCTQCYILQRTCTGFDSHAHNVIFCNAQGLVLSHIMLVFIVTSQTAQCLILGRKAEYFVIDTKQVEMVLRWWYPV